MAAINSSQSPMLLYEESLEESKESSERRKRKLEAKQKLRSPFLIGSIDEVNKRISKLDRKLQHYTELVVESRASDQDAAILPVRNANLSSAKAREMHDKKEKETKQLNQFAGMFSLQSVANRNVSNRVKNINKISMQSSKTALKKDSGKPKFVELHQFPGYDQQQLLQLPHGCTGIDILHRVADAQVNLNKKPQYKLEFEKLFFSELSQAVLQDIFWWFFLEKYQSNKTDQMKLFNRIAYNYVKLVNYAKHPHYRDVFLSDYPELLSQAVYAAFCHSFPDSYRQFGEEFKEEIIELVFQWVTGIVPAPRQWLNWNVDKLEPPGIKVREDMMNNSKASKKSSVLNLDFLDSAISRYSSQSTLNQIGSSKTSVSSVQRVHPSKKQQKVTTKTSVNSQKSVSVVDGDIMDALVPQGTDAIANISTANKSKPSKAKSRMLDTVDTHDALTPIKEMHGEEEDYEHSDTHIDAINPSRISMEYAKSYASMLHTRTQAKKESHPACRGPDFVKTAFNVNGQSPLVAHFLRMSNLEYNCGVNVRVQRTEMENLPPLDAPTYRDVMRESYHKVREIERGYEKLVARNNAEHKKFVQKYKAAQHAYSTKETALLANPREVKRLSDLLILEQRKDTDSIAVGAAAALEAALMAQE